MFLVLKNNLNYESSRGMKKKKEEKKNRKTFIGNVIRQIIVLDF
jgi:hypothetical protein